MTVKESLIRKSIKQIQRKLEDINAILDANPVAEIIKIRREAQTLLDTTTYHDQLTDEFLQKLKQLGERERRQFAISRKCPLKLVNKKVKLTIELDNLNRELFFITRKGNL